MTTLNELSLTELDELRSRGELDLGQLLEDCIARIEEREHEVRAFEYIDFDAARAALAQSGSSLLGRGLEGIPFGAKDIMDTHDMPSGWGSPIYEGSRPVRDAGCIAVLRACGAVVLGKTVTTEFAFLNPNKTRNPCDIRHTPGGSSQGSAAAVADAMLPFALGTQTAASVIRPAAFCGVVGYKSTRGAFDLGGVCALSQTNDSLGFFVRDVRDLGIIRRAMCNGGELAHEVRPLRVGLVRTPHWNDASETTRRVVDAVAGAVREQGIDVREVVVGSADGDISHAHMVVMAYEAARSRMFEYRHFGDQLSDHMRSLIEDGLRIGVDEYQRARELAETWQTRLDDTLSGVDFLLAPSAVDEAPRGLESTGNAIFSRMWNLLGVPGITLPAGTGSSGLPIGVQLIGRMDGDDALIGHAAWLQRLLSR